MRSQNVPKLNRLMKRELEEDDEFQRTERQVQRAGRVSWGLFVLAEKDRAEKAGRARYA